MTCEKVRSELVESWASTELLSVATVEHLEECEHCNREALLLQKTYSMVQALPEERAPEGFTSSVLAQLDREESQPGWLARLGEFFSPPQSPSWARAAAVGTAIALAVAGGTVWYNQAQEPAPEPQIAGAMATPPVAVSYTDTDGNTVEERPYASEIEELLIRHQTVEMTQPLADDAGVSLVVYSSN